MPACGYELKLSSYVRVRYRVEQSKIKFISTQRHVISSIRLSDWQDSSLLPPTHWAGTLSIHQVSVRLIVS